MKKGILLIGLLTLAIRGCTLPEPPYMEVTTDASVFEGRFYYEQLSESEQLIYHEIYEGLMVEQAEICTHSADPDEANAIFLSVIYDFPEIFWADGSATATTHGVEGEKGCYTVLEPVYVYTGGEKEQMQEEIDAAVTQIISSVPAEYDEYGKIKYIYEYLINTVEYVENAPHSQNIYSSLVNHGTVCAGYAKANQYLLNELGIECTYVLGTAAREDKTDNHAWNIVQCNGNYYYIDLTWADPIPAEGDENLPHVITYDYLCCSDSEIEDTHVLQEGYEYPECASDDLNYYNANGMYYDVIDRQQLLDAAYRTIDAKESSTTYKFASKELYEQAKSLIEQDVLPVSAQYLCDKYDIEKVEYYYYEEDDMNKLVVYWIYE